MLFTRNYGDYDIYNTDTGVAIHCLDCGAITEFRGQDVAFALDIIRKGWEL